MVAISLYRGNLHRVPAVPHRWLMPTPKISLKDFKTLLHRRSRALSLLPSTTTTTTNATTSNPNPNLKQEEITITNHENDGNSVRERELAPPVVADPEDALKAADSPEMVQSAGGDCAEKLVEELVKARDEEEVKGEDCLVKSDSQLVTLDADAKFVEAVNASVLVEANGVSLDEKMEAPVNADLEIRYDESLNDAKNRKKEVEKKLKILNERKHNLVQVLKQILNAEEELRRRSNMQGMAVRPSVTLQVDVTNDSGSISRHVTPRPGSEGNGIGDMEGADADDVSNHNMNSCNLLRMSSMSPSSDSLHRRPPHSVVPNPSRATLAVSSSPSRFAPTGQQGNPSSLPTVSVSGTNYIASSPSPAGSGGTSVFRDARLPSPWN